VRASALYPRQFWWTFLLSLALMVGAHCLLVTIVDPRRYFTSSSSFPQIYPNSRRVKVEALARFQQAGPVTGLILGSSRSMLLSPQEFDRRTGLRFFNAGVFSGTAEDFLSLYRLARRNGNHPRVIVLGLDPAAIYEGRPEEELSANFALTTALENRAASGWAQGWHSLTLYKRMLRPQALVEVANSLALRRHPPEPRSSFDADGRLHEHKTERAIQSGQYDFRGELENSRRRMIERLETFQGLSQRRTQLIESLLAQAAADQARVVIWMPPVHPTLLETMARSPQASTADGLARQFTTGLAERYPVQVIDLTHPSAFGGDPDRWYDSIHISPLDADKIARRLAAHGI
jgi:hypothetical protein